jgi:hypothetical protein
MEHKAPSARVKDIDAHIRRLLRPVDLLKESREIREIITSLRQELSDCRIYTDGYELSETREEQLTNAKQAKKYLKAADRDILRLSQYGLFGPVDVAQLSAYIEQVAVDLE